MNLQRTDFNGFCPWEENLNNSTFKKKRFNWQRVTWRSRYSQKRNSLNVTWFVFQKFGRSMEFCVWNKRNTRWMKLVGTTRARYWNRWRRVLYGWDGGSTIPRYRSSTSRFRITDATFVLPIYYNFTGIFKAWLEFSFTSSPVRIIT